MAPQLAPTTPTPPLHTPSCSSLGDIKPRFVFQYPRCISATAASCEAFKGALRNKAHFSASPSVNTQVLREFVRLHNLKVRGEGVRRKRFAASGPSLGGLGAVQSAVFNDSVTRRSPLGTPCTVSRGHNLDIRVALFIHSSRPCTVSP